MKRKRRSIAHNTGKEILNQPYIYIDMENTSIWHWVITAIIGIIGALFGYLIGKGNGKRTDSSIETKILKDLNTQLQDDLQECNRKLVNNEVVAASDKLKVSENTIGLKFPFNGKEAKSVLGKSVKHNELKIVEGIGPKIQEIFHASHITTWKDLSETGVDRCRQILNNAGSRFKMHDPASWPMQAKMAYEGKWKDLRRWQEEHKSGKL
jgi:predicted flap endonuclease-1-like 5' DNA nuclease